MNKSIYLLLLGAAGAQAADVELNTITVESTRLSDVSGEQVKSADLADALTRNVPGVSLVRRSGIANDIILRGQKKDNINILIDNAKIYGACPNRMDPPTSHVLSNNVESIEITEGPYDAENFGTLSGAVKITTQKPAEEFAGEASLNLGSWGYRKLGATVSGGSDKVKFLVSASKEKSAQYEDGDGNDFAQQIENLNPSTMAAMNPRYKTEYRDLDAYDKQTFMAKAYVDVADNQELMLSYTANRSDDILYPSSKMDALYDDSDLFNMEYSIKGIAPWSSSLDIQAYKSTVEHPMSTLYRISSGTASANERISYLETDTRGLKIKNSVDLDDSTSLTVGLDTSKRNWDGTYTGKGTSAGITGIKSIDDVDTKNVALFAEVEKQLDNLNVKVGARYDDTSIDPNTGTLQSNDYNAFGAYLFATYRADNSTRYFGGIGKASRVPDARELYFRSAMNQLIGTPTLNDTSNIELDLGVEKNYQDLTLKTKLFHSWLKDYIYYNANNSTSNAFENIDATIYGVEVSGSWFASDSIYVDFGLAYQRGEKDNALSGQTDTDLAEIPPLKANIALNYDYGNHNTARAEIIAADDWGNHDSDNGEQDISGYAVLNLKLEHAISKQIGITVGMDNVFDRTYATTNTYKDLTLLADTGGDVMLINEPGRYVYLNATYRF